MNNLEAHQYFCGHSSESVRSVTEDFISSFGLDTDQFNHFRLKFANLQNERRTFQRRSDLGTWNSISFCPLPKRPKLHANTTSISFEENVTHSKRKVISDLTIKGSTTGNLVRRCLKRVDDTEKDFLYWILSVVSSQSHPNLTLIYNNLGAILRINNSSRRVDTERLGEICRETYQCILTNFSLVHITPTLHKLLAHAPQIISDYNEGFGLGDLSEEGIEACNKLIRRNRERLSRNFSFEDNIKDVFVRLISQSDPILKSYRVVRKNDFQTDRSEHKSYQDSLVDSLIIELN